MPEYVGVFGTFQDQDQWLQQAYGEYYGIAKTLLDIQRVRDQEASIRLSQAQFQARAMTELAQMRASRMLNLTNIKNLASQIIIAGQNAIAQQQRELDAMRARAQSPSLTNIALGPQAGWGISTPTLQAPNLAAQASVPSLTALGTVPMLGQGLGQGTPVTAWWTWPGAGSSASSFSSPSTAMGSAAGNPALGLWMWGGGGPANQPGQNVPVGMPWPSGTGG